MRERFGVDASAVRDLGLVGAEDRDIFAGARSAGAVVLMETIMEKRGGSIAPSAIV
jgi:hypothetical protein